MISFAGLLPAKKETFPFLAEINSNNVNIRAGQSANFEALCRLNKGDQAVVIAHEYSWYKIQMPPAAKLFISDKYVLVKGTKGIITAKDVNVRAGAGINATILKQLPLGDEVVILEKKQGWLRIAPVPQTFGWVADDLITFKSKDISSFTPKLQELSMLQTPIADSSLPKNGLKAILIAGQLKRLELINNPELAYQIMIGNQPTYYIKAPQKRFDAFLNQQVSIEGTLDSQSKNKNPYPILIVSKIQLIL